MDRLYSRFPGGVVGFGLLLLRLIVAAWFLEIGIPMFGANTVTFFLALGLTSAALLIIAGVGTSGNACVGAICSGVSFLLVHKPDQWFPVLSLAVLSCSLALLGPGGYSLDARLTGWRVIKLSSGQPSSKDAD